MDRAVFEAAASGNFNSFHQGHSEQKILDLLTPERSTILHVSARFNNNKFTEQVLNFCPRLLLEENTAGETPLHTAARVGNQEIVKLLISSAGDVEREQIDLRRLLRMKDLAREDTALHVGVRNGHLEVAKLLIDADHELLDVLNGANESPLFLAVEGGFLAIANYIMEKCGLSSPPSCRGSNGMNALHAAVIRTHHARFLEHHVPDLSLENLRRLMRSFLLHLKECFGRLPQQTEIEIIGVLLEREESQKTALIEEQDNIIKWTPLHFAAWLGHLEATKLILHQNCSSVAYLKDKEGMSALHIAAKEGHVQVMKEIIFHKPEACDLVDNRGWTPLHIAVFSGKLSVVKYILNTPALEFMLNDADKEGNTPLHLAAGLQYKRIINALVNDYRVDKRATNLKYLKPIDIVRTNVNIGEFSRCWFVKKLEQQGGQESLQSIIYRVEQWNLLVNSVDPHHHHLMEKAIKSDRLKKISDTHLLVAALIATVTFTAAFTIPGGYESNDRTDKGLAVLSDKMFFKVFVVADSVAFYCSAASVLLQFFSSVEHNYHLLLRFTRIAATLTYISILGMVMAFTSGLRVIMPDSSSLVYYTLIMGGCCVFLFIIGCL
ncbi:protein ACCELERATED CELL DEATH 6-like [Humulus lupulus]|uniref:protein ACCELERATED CELL DEATH 6-like n=1 Tax=Humulus lupulus TaxID=3486 RepID=UPI002B402F8C|nr:protein ACCELERATED CELL DEATH 6-like [Humulus lupulus]